MVYFAITHISLLLARQLGAAGACLVIVSALAFEFKSEKPKWLVYVLSTLGLIGFVTLGFGLLHLGAVAL